MCNQRLAHVSSADTRDMVSRGVVKGIAFKPNDHMNNSSGFILRKDHRTATSQKIHSLGNLILGLAHSNVLGSLDLPSVGGSNYSSRSLRTTPTELSSLPCAAIPRNFTALNSTSTMLRPTLTVLSKIFMFSSVSLTHVPMKPH